MIKNLPHPYHDHHSYYNYYYNNKVAVATEEEQRDAVVIVEILKYLLIPIMSYALEMKTYPFDIPTQTTNVNREKEFFFSLFGCKLAFNNSD